MDAAGGNEILQRREIGEFEVVWSRNSQGQYFIELFKLKNPRETINIWTNFPHKQGESFSYYWFKFITRRISEENQRLDSNSIPDDILHLTGKDMTNILLNLLKAV